MEKLLPQNIGSPGEFPIYTWIGKRVRADMERELGNASQDKSVWTPYLDMGFSGYYSGEIGLKKLKGTPDAMLGMRAFKVRATVAALVLGLTTAAGAGAYLIQGQNTESAVPVQAKAKK